MKSTLLTLATALTFAIAFTSCKKDEDKKTETPTPAPTNGVASANVHFHFNAGTQAISFESNAGSDSLNKGGVQYVSAFGDSVSFRQFRFFIHGVELIREDNTVWSESEKYHLIERINDGTNVNDFDLSNIPTGTYKAIRFKVGVDSSRNFVVPAQPIGDLRTNLAMNWNWSTGFIFMKMEGRVRDSRGRYRNWQYHIGNPSGATGPGWRAPGTNLETVTCNFPSPIALGKDKAYSVHMNADALSVFGRSADASSNTAPSNPSNRVVMVGPLAMTQKVADNYGASMFMCTGVSESGGHSH